MVWPNIGKSIWSSVIAKLGLFTNVDPSQLELSGTSLRLSDVSVDTSKISNADVMVNDFDIGNLILELNSSGISINAQKVVVKASLMALSAPEMTLSTILEATRDDLAQLGQESSIEPDDSLPAQGSSSMMSRVADMVLSQISLHISDLTVILEISNELAITIQVDQVIMPNKRRIEIESIFITRGPADNAMTQSLFLNGGNSGLPERVADELATINRILFSYDMNFEDFSVEVDHIRADGISCLETAVVLLNEVIFKPAVVVASSPAKLSAPYSRRGKFSIERLELFEFWDSMQPPLTLSSIYAEPSLLRIEMLDLPGILHASPFVTFQMAQSLELRWDVPVSINISFEQLPSFRRIMGRLISILSDIEPPSDSDSAPVNIVLPEFRICVGSGLTMHIFPNRITESGIHITEILATAADGQVLVSDVHLSFHDDLIVEKVKAKITQGFLDELDLIQATLVDDSLAVSNKPTDTTKLSTWNTLPGFSLDIRHVEIYGDDLNVQGFFNIRNGTHLIIRSDFAGTLYGIKGEAKISAQSKDDLESLDFVCQMSGFEFDLNVLKELERKSHKVPTRSDNSSEKVTAKSGNAGETRIPVLNVNFVTEKLVVKVEEAKILVTPGNVSLKLLSKDNVSLNISHVDVDLDDYSSPGNIISVYKARGIELKRQNRDLKLSVANMAVSSCADSFAYITSLPEKFTSTQPVGPKFNVETNGLVNLFDGVSESQFVPSKLSIIDPDSEYNLVNTLDIQDDYLENIRNQSREGSANILLDSLGYFGDLSHSSIEVKIKRAQWQLFDGFDFVENRERMKEAVKRVSKVAQSLSKEQNEQEDHDYEDDDEDAVVGDFMYQSIIITTQKNNAANLHSSVADEMGGSLEFTRSEKPKLVLSLRRVLFQTLSTKDAGKSHLSLVIKDGKISDLVASSKFNHLIAPMDLDSSQNLLVFHQDSAGNASAPELRASVAIKPLKVNLDQDTIEFVNRFFQFSNESQDTTIQICSEPGAAEPSSLHSRASNTSSTEDREANSIKAAEVGNTSGKAFIQRFEFGGLPLTIDYRPKKVNYRSLRSGMAAELLNIFAVKGAKLNLQSSVLVGVDGWDRLFDDLLEVWTPDIRANQLGGLVSGISPIRRMLKVGKGVGQYTVVPIRRSQLTKGAGVVVRRTVEELLRLRTSWLDATDAALDG